ncbi:hypothetical protein MF935_004846, partial [Escherichia coli]|nr:hypothetical protein [Escherichia coli]
FHCREQSPYLRAVDVLRARQATGLLWCCVNNTECRISANSVLSYYS